MSGHEPLEGEVVCGAEAVSCVCVLPPGEHDVHQCRPECGGSWHGEWKKADSDLGIEPDAFEVVTLPLSGRPPTLSDLFRAW